MKLVTFLGILLVMSCHQPRALAGQINSQPGTASPSTSPENFDLYLLIGQSNMAGRAKVEARDTLPSPRILILDASGQWVSKAEPVHFDKPEYVGLGPGLSFAMAMAAENPEKTIGLIPCAVGNTSIDRWVKNGDLYEEAVRRGRVALRNGRLRAILWHQGESDSGDEASAQAYGEKLALMVADVRSDLNAGNAPFLAGLLGDFVVSRTDQLYPLAETVNEGIRKLPERVPNTFVVSTAGLGHRGDTVHFGSQAARMLGQRYAAVLLSKNQYEPR